MTTAGAYPDSLLIDARDADIQLEQIAADDLKRNLGDYLEPNLHAHRMAEAYRNYVQAGGESNQAEYLNMRVAFTETRGRSNRVFSEVIARHARKRDYPMNDTMFRGYVEKAGAVPDETLVTEDNGEDGEAQFADAWSRIVQGGARHLEKFGWWKCRELAPERLVRSLHDKVMNSLSEQFGADVDAALEGKEGAPMQIKHGSAQASTDEELYELSSDPLLLAIVQHYMGVQPIFNTPVAFLNSAVKPKNERDLSDAAQLYHHDLHRLGFVKVFIYLTDVDEESGPHSLVQKTHRDRPDALWADGRHTDRAIVEAGLADDQVNITGKAGTVFLVDTSCLHRGAHPTAAPRLMAQVQYVNSLFGKPIAQSDHKIDGLRRNANIPNCEEVAALVRKYAARSGTRFMQNFI